MTSVDPKQKDSWLDRKNTQKVGLVKKKRQKQEENDQEPQYDTLYRQSYNRRNEKEEK